MRKPGKLWLPALALIALALGLAVSVKPDAEAPLHPTANPPAPATKIHTLSTNAQALPTSALPAALPPSAPKVHWTAALSSPQPYAEAKRLREARLPGSFLASLAITKACRTAWAQANLGQILGPARDPLAGAANDPNLAKRLQAKALINTRCEPFTQDRNMEVPLADDAHGQAAYKAIKWHPGDSAAALADAAQRLAEQGQLHQFRSPLYRWNGQSMREEHSLYDSALALARQLATTPAENVAEDVRLLELCVRLGRCGSSSEVWFQGTDISPERRRQIEALAQEMAQAMRDGDYQKFLR